MVLPPIVVISVTFLMALVVLPRSTSPAPKPRWHQHHLHARRVGGPQRLAAAIVTVIAANYGRLGIARKSRRGRQLGCPADRDRCKPRRFRRGCRCHAGFQCVRDAVLQMPGGPLVSLVVAMNALAALTGTASGGMAIALNALGAEYMRPVAEYGIDPALMHRSTTISAGTLDAPPGQRHRASAPADQQTHAGSYFDMVMTVIVGVIISLVAVFVLGSMFGSF